jgi:NADH dehydrogenase FAD-containing subunit
VQIITREKIRIVTSNFLEAESGKKIESDYNMDSSVNGYGIPIVPEVERTNAGKVVVDEYSKISAFNTAFAIGDISVFKIADSQGGSIDNSKNLSLQLAQFAVRQASFVAKYCNIRKRAQND